MAISTLASIVDEFAHHSNHPRPSKRSTPTILTEGRGPGWPALTTAVLI